MRHIVFPNDAMLREVYGGGLAEDPKRAARAYAARLERAEARGILPRRVYVSPRRYGYDKAELEAALATLPRSYASIAPAGSHAA
jgi:hypothetical protein